MVATKFAQPHPLLIQSGSSILDGLVMCTYQIVLGHFGCYSPSVLNNTIHILMLKPLRAMGQVAHLAIFLKSRALQGSRY